MVTRMIIYRLQARGTGGLSFQLYMVTGSCRRQKLVPLQISPSARGCKFL